MTDRNPTDPKVYPVTAALEAELVDYRGNPTIELFIETMAAYEHGSADLEDVGAPDGDTMRKLTLRQYAAVALDLALVVANQS